MVKTKSRPQMFIVAKAIVVRKSAAKSFPVRVRVGAPIIRPGSTPISGTIMKYIEEQRVKPRYYECVISVLHYGSQANVVIAIGS